MSRAKRKAPNRMATRKPRVPKEPTGWWRGMSPKRLQMASTALGACGDEDTTAEERDALNEYIALGGNVAGL